MNDRWALDLEDLSEERAKWAAELLTARGVPAVPVDPRLWLTWHLDRASIEALIVGLRAGLDRGSVSGDAAAAIASLLEDCESWVADLGLSDD